MELHDRHSLRNPPPPPGQRQEQPRQKLPFAAVLVCLAAVVIGIWIGAGAEKTGPAKPGETVGMQLPPETTTLPAANQEDPAPDQGADDPDQVGDAQVHAVEGGIEYAGHVYKVYDMGLTWTEARALCEDLGGHLVTITSQEEQEVIQQLLDEASRYEYWIGAYYDDGNFVWVTEEAFEYQNWLADQPDHRQGIEEYAHIFSRDIYRDGLFYAKYSWNDIMNDIDTLGDAYFNSSTLGFICEWEP